MTSLQKISLYAVNSKNNICESFRRIVESFRMMFFFEAVCDKFM